MSAVTLKLDEDLKERLEALAKASGQELSAFVSAALRMFVDESDETAAAIEAGVREADQGDLLDYGEVRAELVAKMASMRA
jgi:predicted transcriptional regulator